MTTIPRYPPPYMHSSIAQMQLQRDWWRERCMEAMKHIQGSGHDIGCEHWHSECSCGTDALRKAISEARETK